MIAIILTLFIGLCAFFVFSAEDLLNKTPHSKLAWGISIILVLLTIGCLFVMKDEIQRQTIINYHDGKYRLEMVVNTDTTYFVKKVK